MKKPKKESKFKFYRSEGEALEFEWIPRWGISPNWDGRRNRAILDIASRLPEEAAKNLEQKADTFNWFIPSHGSLAGVHPFPITHCDPAKLGLKFSRVLYLSPKLEQKNYDIVIACIVHELAHIILDRPMESPSPNAYCENEKEAWNLVSKWGFAKEARKHELSSYYTVAEVAKKCDVTPLTVKNWIMSGKLKAVQLGSPRVIRITLIALDDFLTIRETRGIR